VTDVLLVEPRGEVEIVTLNRPQALNALSVELVEALKAYMSALPGRREVRVVILRANGRAFCAGADIKGGLSGARDGDVDAMSATYRVQLAIGDIMRAMRAAPQPIIALGHGAACGGGFSLMLSADVRYGAPSLRMNAAYIRVGLSGCDMASSYLLPRLVGASVAAEFLLSGRFMDAERALRCGLLSEIVEEERLLETGLALAGDMLANAPLGLRLTKQALNLNIDAPSLEAAMALEDRQQVMLSFTGDHREAMKALAERRPPTYRDN
jgi:enoyl-CoA hydratase/carnithine racemase